MEFRDFQKKLQEIHTDVLLHAPTGSGKTEAALNWVYANQYLNGRVFYLLPYTASINAMVTRLENVYEEGRVTPLHSRTLDFFFEYLQRGDEEQGDDCILQKQNEAFSRRHFSKELFYPVKVATPHQLLRYSLRGKGWEMGLFDLKNALFIIDEFHTYEPLLTGLLFATISWLKREFDVKVLFMSATIPDFMEKMICKLLPECEICRPDPDSISDREILNRKRHIITCTEDRIIIEDIEEISDLLEAGKSVLVIVNNVKTAQELYRSIKFKGNRCLLHGGFNRKRRKEIENIITEKDYQKRPQLLVATQAVEVSLDIDYDLAFIENAPIDALIQRFGRVNRAGKKGSVPIRLYKKMMGKTPFYDEEVLEKTWQELLFIQNAPFSEQELLEVCNRVYKEGYNDVQQKDFNRGYNNSLIKNYREEMIAGDWNPWVNTILEDKTQKREVLCENLIEEYNNLKTQKRYIEASQLLVSVYPYELKDVNCHEKDEICIAYGMCHNDELGYIMRGRLEGKYEELCL